jgi:hypothetical protein
MLNAAIELEREGLSVHEACMVAGIGRTQSATHTSSCSRQRAF